MTADQQQRTAEGDQGECGFHVFFFEIYDRRIIWEGRRALWGVHPNSEILFVRLG